MQDQSDSIRPEAPQVLLRKLAASAYRRGWKRWGEAQPPVDPEHLVRLWDRQQGRCAVSGLPFSEERFEDALVKHPYRESLDRIDPRRRYLEGNMRLVCTAANFGMGEWGDKVLRRIAGGMTARRSTPEALTIWYAERYEEIGRLYLDLESSPPQQAAATTRRVAALRRSITLGPEGLGKAARRAAKRKAKVPGDRDKPPGNSSSRQERP